ncbi:hypothetical protein ACH3XW_9105 [Acanthocheilonema viteae]
MRDAREETCGDSRVCYGYIREKKSGCCVPAKLCYLKKQNKTCGPNQKYRQYGTVCPQTCDGVSENCAQKCVGASRECSENGIYWKCGNPCQKICGEQREKDCNGCVEGYFCKLASKYIKCLGNETFNIVVAVKEHAKIVVHHVMNA